MEAEGKLKPFNSTDHLATTVQSVFELWLLPENWLPLYELVIEPFLSDVSSNSLMCVQSPGHNYCLTYAHAHRLQGSVALALVLHCGAEFAVA